MSKPAARLTDMHVCPMQTPAVVPIPHVGGPIAFPGEPRVLIGGLPAARVGDFCICVGPPDPIAMGSFTVLIGGKPAARMGDMTGHGGSIVGGYPQVLIGDSGGGAGSPAGFTMGGARAAGAAFTRTTCPAEGAMKAAQQSPLGFAGDPNKKSWIEIELVDQKGKPVPHERYRVTPPGEKPMEGFLDAKGFARIDGIDPGTCQIGFPDLDAASWKPEKGDLGRTSRPIPVSSYRPSIQNVAVRVPHLGRPSIGKVSVARLTLTRPSVGPATIRRLGPGIGTVTVRVVSGPRIQLHDDHYQLCRSVKVTITVPDGPPRDVVTDKLGWLDLGGLSGEVAVDWTSSDGAEAFRARVTVPAADLSETAWYLAHLRNWGFAKEDQGDRETILRFQATTNHLDLTGELDQPTKTEIDRIRSGPMAALTREIPVVAPAAGEGDAPVVRPPVGMAASEALYYLAIDGTEAMDSAVYGELLENRSWYNLAHFLDPAPDDANRLHDQEHPFLPVCLFNTPARRRKVAVVCPLGRDAHGKDPFWRAYRGERPEEQPDGRKDWNDEMGEAFSTVGRHTAAEKSVEYTRTLFYFPIIEVVPDPDRVGKLKAHFFGSIDGLPGERVNQPFRADLLFLSSHGFLGGHARPSGADPWPAAEPDSAQKAYFPRGSLFRIPRDAADGAAFFGPRWIILAQCSTMNEATWDFWVTVMARSNPPVRGILAYEEASPDAVGSITIARRFFGNLETMPMVDAWRAANQAERWAAIVHREAVNDRLSQWRRFGPLTIGADPLAAGDYLGFLANDKPKPIKRVDPKFSIHLEQRMDPFPRPATTEGSWDEVIPSRLGSDRVGCLWANSAYRVTVEAPGGALLQAAWVRWVHIRPTYQTQIRVADIFPRVAVAPDQAGLADVEVGVPDPYSVHLRALGNPLPQLQVRLDSAPSDQLSKAHLVSLHSFLWLRVTIKLDNGQTETSDFKTTGLEYL